MCNDNCFKFNTRLLLTQSVDIESNAIGILPVTKLSYKRFLAEILTG